MYKIMTRLHTETPSIWRVHRVNGVEFDAATEDEVKEEVERILRFVGSCDLRIFTDVPYYLDLDYTEDPEFSYEEDKAKALKLLCCVGWNDLRIADNKPFDISVILGEKPEEEVDYYTLTIEGPEDTVIEPNEFKNVRPSDVNEAIVVLADAGSFHFNIDGEDAVGIPEWIRVVAIDDRTYSLTFVNIDQDRIVKIIKD